MYSSVLGGIVTDPALMVLPLDDHMVHRGHAVFDTATLTHGMLYQLDPHLDRLIKSADGARIPPPFPRERLRQIILETAAASRQREGSVRYWLSAGPGGFGLGPGGMCRQQLLCDRLQTGSLPGEATIERASNSSPARCRSNRRSSPVSNRPIIYPMCWWCWKPKTVAPTTAFSSTSAAWSRKLQHERSVRDQRSCVPPSALRRDPVGHHDPKSSGFRPDSRATRRVDRRSPRAAFH